MELNKKGFVFSIIAFFIIATAVVFVLAVGRTNELTSVQTQAQRIQVVDQFVQTVHQDAQEAFSIAGFSSIYDLQVIMIDKQESLAELDIAQNETEFVDLLDSLIASGKLDGYDVSQLQNNNFNAWKHSIEQLGTLQGVVIEFSDMENLRVDISDTCFALIFQAQQNFTVRDKFTESKWTETVDLGAIISIEMFFNPLGYQIGLTPQPIVQGEEADVGVFAQAFGAPDFIQRFLGILEAGENGCGIATLFDPNDPDTPDGGVDYEYVKEVKQTVTFSE